MDKKNKIIMKLTRTYLAELIFDKLIHKEGIKKNLIKQEGLIHVLLMIFYRSCS
jgi:hypothetical protein